MKLCLHAKGKDKNYGYVKGKQIGSGNNDKIMSNRLWRRRQEIWRIKQSGASNEENTENDDKIIAASAGIEVSPRGRQSGSDGEAEANPQAKAKGQPKRQWTQIPFRWSDEKNRLPERRKFKPWNRGLDKQLCPIKSTRVENGNSSRNQNGHEWASNGSPRARIDRMLFISLLAPMPYFLGVFCTPTGIKNTDLYIFLFST